jgi:Fe-S cluster biogenesis protein NfuA
MATAMTDGASRNGAAPRDTKVQTMGDRVEALLAGFDSVSNPRIAREQAEELVRTIVGLYGAGLERVLSVVHEAAGDRSEEIFDRLVDDKFVETLLCLHDLHPIPVEERVGLALDSVRPYLKSHEGGVEIASVAAGVVTLRLEGNCKGCPSSTLTVKNAVERAILERVPEIREVVAETAAPAANPVYDECTISLDEIVLQRN